MQRSKALPRTCMPKQWRPGGATPWPGSGAQPRAGSLTAWHAIRSHRISASVVAISPSRYPFGSGPGSAPPGVFICFYLWGLGAWGSLRGCVKLAQAPTAGHSFSQGAQRPPPLIFRFFLTFFQDSPLGSAAWQLGQTGSPTFCSACGELLTSVSSHDPER